MEGPTLRRDSTQLRNKVRLALAVLLAFLGLASSAQAQAVADPDFWKQTAERQDTVSRFFYRQSPQAIPSSYDPVAEAEQILRQRQAALPPSNPQAPSLWQRIRGVTGKTGLSKPLRALGTIGLAVGTLEVGWQIGSGINAKFLKLGVPPATDGPDYYRWDRIRWLEANSREYYGAFYPAQDGWVIELKQTCCNYSEVDRWFGAPCTFSGFVPPDPFVTQGPAPAAATCWTPDGPSPIDVYWGWAPENALGAPGPIEDYTNQPYGLWSPAPATPPQTTVEESIENELEQPENDLLLDWLNYQLGAPNAEDPVGNGPPNAGIEFIDFEEHFEQHEDDFPEYGDPWEYWQGAVDVVERGDRDPNGSEGVLRCERSDGALIYWDLDKRALVIVKDGKITTFFKPEGPPPADFQYWENECNQ